MRLEEELQAIRERLVRLEEAVNNHLVHEIRNLDVKLWALVMLLLGHAVYSVYTLSQMEQIIHKLGYLLK